MKSPLEYDQKIVKEFDIDKNIEIDKEVQIGYVRAQLDEIKKFLYRERVELILSEAQANIDIEALAASARTKVAEHRNNIRGVVVSIKVLNTFLHELNG